MKAVLFIFRVVYFLVICVPVAGVLLALIELSSINIINREVAQR